MNHSEKMRLMSAQEIKALPIQLVVNDEAWQIVRKSLVGNWVRNHRHNVVRLHCYLVDEDWRPMAVRQVLNVLTGTVHRAGHTAGQPETDELRGLVRRVWKQMLGESYDPEDPVYRDGVIGAGVKDVFPQ